MKRKDFLRELENLLSGLPEDERNEAAAYYRDYFDEAGLQDEDEIPARAGSPEKAAAKIAAGDGRTEAGRDDAREEPECGRDGGSWWTSFAREGKSCREEWSKWRKEREQRFERDRRAADGRRGDGRKEDPGMHDSRKESGGSFSGKSFEKMRRRTKVLLAAALLFAVIGGACCIASLCLGFSRKEFAKESHMGSGPLQEVPEDNEKIEFEQNYSNVKELSIDIAAGQCELIPWEGDTWKVTGYGLPSDFKCKMYDEELRIKSGARSLGFWDFYRKICFVRIMVPAGKVLDEFEFDCGIGGITMKDGMLACRTARVDCGIGDCTLRLDIGEEIELKAGTGDVDLLLAGSREDFAYKVECGVGDVTLDGAEYSSADMEADSYEAGDSRKYLKAECSVGSLKIRFA